VVHFEAEKITREAMITLFDRLATRHLIAATIEVVLDNASYHRSAAIKAYLARDGCRIRLVYLPAYSPNLNLIERLWWFLKKTTLWHEHYPTFAQFRAAIDGFFEKLPTYREELNSLLTDRFRFIGVSQSQIPYAEEYNSRTHGCSIAAAAIRRCDCWRRAPSEPVRVAAISKACCPSYRTPEIIFRIGLASPASRCIHRMYATPGAGSGRRQRRCQPRAIA
jgi:transposase